MALWQVDLARLSAHLEQIDAELQHLQRLQELLWQYAQGAPDQTVQLRRVQQKVEDLMRSRRVVRQAICELQSSTRKLSADAQKDIQMAEATVKRLF